MSNKVSLRDNVLHSPYWVCVGLCSYPLHQRLAASEPGLSVKLVGGCLLQWDCGSCGYQGIREQDGCLFPGHYSQAVIARNAWGSNKASRQRSVPLQLPNARAQRPWWENWAGLEESCSKATSLTGYRAGLRAQPPDHSSDTAGKEPSKGSHASWGRASPGGLSTGTSVPALAADPGETPDHSQASRLPTAGDWNTSRDTQTRSRGAGFLKAAIVLRVTHHGGPDFPS